MNNTGESTILESTVNQMSASNDGKLDISIIRSDKFNLTNRGNTKISESTIKSIDANNSRELDARNINGDNLTLTSSGHTNIVDSQIKSVNSKNSGNLDVKHLTSDKLVLTSKGETLINDSNIANVNANVGGKATINNLTNTQMTMTVSGETNVNNSTSDKIKVTNSGKTNLKDIDVKANANLINRNGNMNINNIHVANNLDVDSNSGSINMSGIDVNIDFNFALAGNSGVKFSDITIGNDFNIYAGKAVLNGSTLNVGNDMHTYTYSKYSSPKASLRAAVAHNSGTGKASEKEEGFSLILDQLNIGGGLYVDNPDVTIKVKESQVGHDVKIDAGKENIQIDKLDVDGGNLDIKGTTGAIKLGDINVDNDTKINLNSGDLTAKSLDSKGKVDFNVGGNISSTNIIKSEISTVKAVAGGNLTASTVEAKNNIDLNVGGNITSDNKIETEKDSVNMIAGGSVNAYKVLAKQQGNIEAVNGDIIIGQIDGKTLVFKQDTNDRALRIREANVETNITAGSDFIDINVINQTADDARLGIDFTRVNGRAMNNVIIADVKTNTGVNMFNLVSTYATIHVSNEIFNLKQTYLLKKGDLSSSNLKFRLFGDNPKFSGEPDIIAFFAPLKNHKAYADISFTNEWKPEKQDYYPLTAKNDYKRMFNQYTVVQDFETLRLAYEDRIDDLHDDIYGNFDYRRVNNSKAFFIDFGEEVSTGGESVNLEDVDIPVSVEFDSASGELKVVGSQVKAQKAVD